LTILRNFIKKDLRPTHSIFTHSLTNEIFPLSIACPFHTRSVTVVSRSSFVLLVLNQFVQSGVLFSSFAFASLLTTGKIDG